MTDSLSRLQPYTAYKPSGVPWLGDVPVHWEVVQLGRIGVFSKGSGGTKEDEVPDGIPCVRYGDLYTTHNHFISHPRSYVSPAKASAYTPIHRGDVLFPTSGETIEEIGKSAVNLLDTHVLCGGDMIIFRPTIPMEPKFAGYALDCPAAQTQKSLMGRGITIMHIYSGQLKYLWLSLPPLPEQTAIVRYLDYVDRRIRCYVSAKRKLISLLEEERQAVVNRAVTRGLDPNVRLKPSGVEWLGDVPEHWEVRRLKSLAAIGTGGRDTINRREDGLYPFFVRSQTVERIDTWSFDGEAVLTAGDGVGVGKVFHYANGRFDYHQRVYKFSDFRHILGKFFFHYFGSTLRNEVLQGTAKSTVDSLRLPMLQNFPVAIPSQSQQRAIIEYVDEVTADIDAAIARARRQIELLQEYRTRLIADVVTGKLDVREAASQLPDEGDEEGPIDRDGLVLDNMDDGSSDVSQLLEEEQTMEREVTA